MATGTVGVQRMPSPRQGCIERLMHRQFVYFLHKIEQKAFCFSLSYSLIHVFDP